MKAMDTLQDLIEEAKLRTVWWALCIFAVAYFFSHTSKSMWMNFPISVLLVALLRTLFNKMELKWRVRSKVSSPSYLSHLKRKQLSVNDSRLSTAPSPPKWKRKIDSPLVEAAVDELISKILQDFVIDLWYAEITPDREAPELIRAVIMEALGEISGRVKELNLVDLLTRDLVDLIGDHVELFRKNQAEIGVDVMGTLSCEERDDRLKHHLMASKALHPALISPESEYKVLQRLIGGILAVVLRPKEAQCPLVRCIARELVTCLVLQPVLNLASPVYINELVEHILLTIIDGKFKEAAADQSSSGDYHNGLPVTGKGIQASESTSKTHTPSFKLDTNTIDKVGEQREKLLASNGIHEEHMQPRPADWARVLEAATRRRTEVLMPENLENMWTKGRNYKNKVCSIGKSGNSEPIAKGSGMESSHPVREVENKILNIGTSNSTVREDKAVLPLMHGLSLDAQSSDERKFSLYLVQNSYENGHHVDELEHPSSVDNNGNKVRLKRSNSTSDLRVQSNFEKMLTWEGRGPVIAEYWSPSFYRHNEPCSAKSASNLGFHSEGQYTPKLRCRVLGAYFEKIASKSFAVYSIAVTDAGNNTWFVKRRYSNFERLHRHLKDIPNYTLHLPPKRIFSSSTEDAFVHQRCIQLDRYLLDLLSIANVAEQHEVWDFLSASSKNYSFGKSSSVMRTLAVNVDDAVDDIVRQFKGVSDGLMRKVVGSSTPHEASPSISAGNLSWHTDDNARHNDSETTNNFSDNEEYDKDAFHEHDEVDSVEIATGWHSDNELNSKGFPPRVIKQSEKASKHGDGRKNFNGKKKQSSTVIFEGVSLRGFDDASFPVTADYMEDPACMPPEWTPPNVSVPILNLVDKIFQLKRRGWLRRQVFWISKQILQLMMEDAIDDWLLRQIRWLRRENVIAQGIRWVQDVIWPDGTFFLRPRCNQGDIYDGKLNQSASVGASNLSRNGSFEQQLEAARRASNVKKLIFDGAPTALVSLIGSKQYKRCAKDIYYFLQSTICIKQVTFGVLELVIISIFPELRDLVVDIHKQMRAQAL